MEPTVEELKQELMILQLQVKKKRLERQISNIHKNGELARIDKACKKFKEFLKIMFETDIGLITEKIAATRDVENLEGAALIFDNDEMGVMIKNNVELLTEFLHQTKCQNEFQIDIETFLREIHAHIRGFDEKKTDMMKFIQDLNNACDAFAAISSYPKKENQILDIEFLEAACSTPKPEKCGVSDELN